MAKFHISFPHSNITPEEYKRLQKFLALLTENCKVPRTEAQKIHNTIDWRKGVSIELPESFSIFPNNGKQYLYYSTHGKGHLIATNNAKKNTNVDLENLRKILGKEEVEQNKNQLEIKSLPKSEKKDSLLTNLSSSYAYTLSSTMSPQELLKLITAVESANENRKKPKLYINPSFTPSPSVTPHNTAANSPRSPIVESEKKSLLKPTTDLFDVPLTSSSNTHANSNANSPRSFDEEDYDDCNVPLHENEEYEHVIPPF